MMGTADVERTHSGAAYDAETVFALDWEEIRGQLQRSHGIKLAEDDPLLLAGEVFSLAWKKAAERIIGVGSGQITSSMADLNRELEEGAKQRREEAHRDIMALSVIARGELNAATAQSIQQIKAATTDLTQAAKELKLQDRSMRWHDWFVGALFMAVVLVTGVCIGRWL